MSNKLNNARQLAEKFGQEHLLKFINAIPNRNREKLINQILSIDFKLDDGDLLYGDANIIAHLFLLKTLKDISKEGLPYHTAIKNVPYIDDSGEIIKPDKPNAFKFETFIFDAFEYLDDLAILRVERNKEFAPIKNCTGEDSPETAKILLEANQNEEFI